MGVSNHLPRSELKRKSKVSNAGGHVTLENDHKIACCQKDEDEVGHTLIRTFLDLKSLWAIAGFRPWPLLAPSSPGSMINDDDGMLVMI